MICRSFEKALYQEYQISIKNYENSKEYQIKRDDWKITILDDKNKPVFFDNKPSIDDWSNKYYISNIDWENILYVVYAAYWITWTSSYYKENWEPYSPKNIGEKTKDCIKTIIKVILGKESKKSLKEMWVEYENKNIIL